MDEAELHLVLLHAAEEVWTTYARKLDDRGVPDEGDDILPHVVGRVIASDAKHAQKRVDVPANVAAKSVAHFAESRADVLTLVGLGNF